MFHRDKKEKNCPQHKQLCNIHTIALWRC